MRLDIEGTSLLTTVVAAGEAKPGQSFLPLTVDYVEKTYAGGFIPQGMFRREGMPAEETLTARLIDRSLRPLFPKWFKNEVHVVIHVLSSDPLIEPDIPALLAAATAVQVAGLPPTRTYRRSYRDKAPMCNEKPEIKLLRKPAWHSSPCVWKPFSVPSDSFPGQPPGREKCQITSFH